MRILTILLGLFFAINVHSQSRKPPQNNKDPFLNTQWYMGFRGGVNLSKATPTASYSAISPLNFNASETSKTYDGLSHPGGQAALVFTFYTRGFSVSLEPGFITNVIEHSTTSSWSDSENSQNTLELMYNHRTKLNYLEFPLTVKYDLMRGVIRPFVGFGGYYGLLLNATRTIERSGTDSASGNSGPFTDAPVTIGITEQFIKSSLGIKAVAGVSYDPGNIRIIFDIGYSFGLNNITDTANRYNENLLSGIGEATDDIKLQYLAANLSVVFPLKFIGKNFNAFN